MAATTNSEPTAGRLAGKVAWVTGSSRGIGRVVAGHLAALGAQVAIHGTSPTSTRAFGEADSLDAVAAEIAERTGAEVLAVHGDLTSEDTVKELCAQIRDRFGAIHILVNNAGGDIGTQGTTGKNAGKPASNDALGISLADIRTVLDRNLLTCILPCREVAPEMVERGRGWIVNVGSVAGLRGRASEVIYGCAKAAVHHYTRCLADQLRPGQRERQRHRAGRDCHPALPGQPHAADGAAGGGRQPDPLRLACRDRPHRRVPGHRRFLLHLGSGTARRRRRPTLAGLSRPPRIKTPRRSGARHTESFRGASS